MYSSREYNTTSVQAGCGGKLSNVIVGGQRNITWGWSVVRESTVSSPFSGGFNMNINKKTA